MTNKRESHIRKHPEQYVVGKQEDGYCWVLSANPSEPADDQNLETAQRFPALQEAIEVALEEHAGVFEVLIDECGNETIVEVLVVPEKIKSMPYDGVYQLTAGLFIGPTFVCNRLTTSQRRILNLSKAKIDTVVSLLSRGELFWQRSQLDQLWFDELFRQHYFPIADQGVPTPDLMNLILDTVDSAIEQRHRVLVHCVGGRGRSGLVAGCFISRHGMATGMAALNYLARLRYQFGLFKPSPENFAQCAFVENWKEGK